MHFTNTDIQIADKHQKVLSTSLVIRKIKTVIRTKFLKCWEDYETATENSLHWWWHCKVAKKLIKQLGVCEVRSTGDKGRVQASKRKNFSSCTARRGSPVLEGAGEVVLGRSEALF